MTYGSPIPVRVYTIDNVHEIHARAKELRRRHCIARPIIIPPPTKPREAKAIARPEKERDWLFVSSKLGPELLGVHQIQGLVSDIFDVLTIDLQSNRRFHRIAYARHCLYWLSRRFTTCSYPQIGLMLGRDHTTVLHGVRSIDSLVRRTGLTAKENHPRAWAIELRDYLERSS